MQTLTDWRFFATAKTEEGKWPGLNVNWETVSVNGKNIEIFSYMPEEHEVLFPPGTRYHVDEIMITPRSNPDYPQADIHMRQQEK
ncbi:hypothetical protein ACFQUU_28230 [Herbaspirillum sp. GCM10030257]|uniref:hypothetical protein n=1 Tax=Herbaspirillum sp. GCM10030257 TaxID=3273393 RepID=UPI00361E1A94